MIKLTTSRALVCIYISYLSLIQSLLYTVSAICVKKELSSLCQCFVSCIVNLEYEEVEMLAAACSGWGAMHCNVVKWAGQLAGH